MKRIAICCLAAVFLVWVAASTVRAEIPILTITDYMVYSEDGEFLGVTEEYDDYIQSLHDQGIPTNAVSFRILQSAYGAFYAPDGTLVGVLEEADLTDLRYWCTKDDPFYHINSACSETLKAPISLEAAILFEKTACPECTLGDHINDKSE